jgi:hypothetical protein
MGGDARSEDFDSRDEADSSLIREVSRVPATITDTSQHERERGAG